MAKKFIISESAVRRFQKLATIKPVNEMYGGKKGDESRSHRDYMEEAYDDAMEEEVEVEEEEEVIEEPPAAADMEAAEMDMAAAEDELAAAGAAEGAEEMARAVIQAVADALGVEIDIDGGEEVAMDAEEEVEVSDDGEEVAMDAEEEEVMQEMGHEDSLEEVEMIDEEALTEAVMKRVLTRLKEMTAANKKS